MNYEACGFGCSDMVGTTKRMGWCGAGEPREGGHLRNSESPMQVDIERPLNDGIVHLCQVSSSCQTCTCSVIGPPNTPPHISRKPFIGLYKCPNPVKSQACQNSVVLHTPDPRAMFDSIADGCHGLFNQNSSAALCPSGQSIIDSAQPCMDRAVPPVFELCPIVGVTSNIIHVSVLTMRWGAADRGE